MKAVLTYEQFEEIILNPDRFIEWNNVFKHHTDIELNIPTETINNLETDIDSVLFQFIRNTGGKCCNTFDPEINIEKNPSIVLFDKDVKTDNIGYFRIDPISLDFPFKLSYSKNLEKNAIVQQDDLKGWQAIFKTIDVESNSLIINDSYIFDANEHKNKLGSKNIIHLINNILPKEFNINYQILINTDTSHNKTNTFYDAFIPDLINEIQKLRDYQINTEIIVGEGFHKRKLFTNYLNITTDKGFKIFDVKDLAKVLEQNDITIETMFTRHDPSQGDSQYQEMKIRLKELRKLIKNSLDWINADTYNQTRCFYYSNFNETKPIKIRNRLFNA